MAVWLCTAKVKHTACVGSLNAALKLLYVKNSFDDETNKT